MWNYIYLIFLLHIEYLESRESNGKAPFQKPNISKLIKSFKSSLSHFLENLYKEEEEEEGREMVIGYPTDVRHVTHVGVEGLNNTKPKELPEFLSLGCVSSLSVGQFEKAMEAQTAGAVMECSSLPRQHGQLGVVQVWYMLIFLAKILCNVTGSIHGSVHRKSGLCFIWLFFFYISTCVLNIWLKGN